MQRLENIDWDMNIILIKHTHILSRTLQVIYSTWKCTLKHIRLSSIIESYFDKHHIHEDERKTSVIVHLIRLAWSSSGRSLNPGIDFPKATISAIRLSRNASSESMCWTRPSISTPKPTLTTDIVQRGNIVHAPDI